MSCALEYYLSEEGLRVALGYAAQEIAQDQIHVTHP